MKGAIKHGIAIGASVALTLAAIAAINRISALSTIKGWVYGGGQ